MQSNVLKIRIGAEVEDNIATYENSRYMSGHEGVRRALTTRMSISFPPILRLPVHEDDNHYTTFNVHRANAARLLIAKRMRAQN